MNILTKYEQRRGCGYRKAGGLYLVSGGYGRHCGALPIELSVCPTCHAGFKPARGWTWVNLATLASVRGCELSAPLSTEGDPETRPTGCGDCPIADAKIQDVGLIWVGEKFYPDVHSFCEEAGRMGISRRISAIPRKFVVGETWVALAHRKCIPFTPADGGAQEWKAGIFHVFQPRAIEYVVKGTELQEELEALEKRGLTLVKVIPVVEQKTLPV